MNHREVESLCIMVDKQVELLYKYIIESYEEDMKYRTLDVER